MSSADNGKLDDMLGVVDQVKPIQSFSLTMLLIIDGSSENIAHAWWKTSSFEEEKNNLVTVVPVDTNKCLREIIVPISPQTFSELLCNIRTMKFKNWKGIVILSSLNWGDYINFKTFERYNFDIQMGIRVKKSWKFIFKPPIYN